LQVKNFIKIYPKVKHGWTVRYNDSDATAVKAANESHKDMLRVLLYDPQNLLFLRPRINLNKIIVVFLIKDKNK